MVVKKDTYLFQEGQALIEIILAIALAVIILPGLVFTMIGVREAFSRTSVNQQANTLLQKEVEAIRSIKDNDWNSLTSGGPYHTELAGTVWTKASNPITETNDLTRSFTVTDVCRTTPTSAITAPPCTGPNKIDPSTKKITVTVSWAALGGQTISSSFYITRYFGNKAWIQTSFADFDTGSSKVNTAVTPTGEVEIAPTPSLYNWKAPRSPAIQNIPINEDTNDVFVVGNRAYVVGNSRNNAGTCGNCELIIYNITTPTSPAYLGGRDLGGNAYAIVVSGNYAYIATDINSSELLVVNISNPAILPLAGSYNSQGNVDGRGIAVSGNTAYLVTDNNTVGSGFELYALNITNIATSSTIPLLGGSNLGASARDIYVFGGFAYIASTLITQELQVVNLSTLAAPTNYNISTETSAQTVFVSGTTTYIGSGNNLYLLNTASLASITQIGTFSAGGLVNGVYVSGGLAFLATSNSLADFQTVNLCTPSAPILQGSTNLGGLAYGVFVVGNFAYLATGDDSSEFKVIEGGPAYQSTNPITYESAPFNANLGANVGFNLLNWVANPLLQFCTTTRFQITTFNGIIWSPYSGPTGAGSFYNSPGAIALDNILAQQIRYRITFTGNGHSTPSIQEASINYSP